MKLDLGANLLSLQFSQFYVELYIVIDTPVGIALKKKGKQIVVRQIASSF